MQRPFLSPECLARGRPLFFKPMSKSRRRTIYVIAALVILAVTLTIVYRLIRHNPVHLGHSPRASQHDAAAVIDGQMLQGKFGNTVSPEERQIVMAQLHAPDQSYPAPPGAGTDAHAGKQRIILTQPLGTTVEDSQPTLTSDTP